MFTGIVQAMGRVARIGSNSFGAKLVIDPGNWSLSPAAGDSIAVNGCCLTYAPDAGQKTNMFAFDVIRQTFQNTTLRSLNVGDVVNLESALTPTTPMGGHFVQGHVDGVGKIAQLRSGADECRITISADAQLMQYVIPKGSIAIDGISLTVADVDVATLQFEVALIPTTLRDTTLGKVVAGRSVNLETDLVAKTVVHWLSSWSKDTASSGRQKLTLDKLRDEGFA